MTFIENILDVGASNKFVIEGTEREGIWQILFYFI